MRKRVAILGSTGSIGRNCLDVLDGLADRFELVGLAAQNSWELLSEQAGSRRVPWVGIGESRWSRSLKTSLNGCTQVIDGPRSMEELIEACGCDIVVCGVVGAAGLNAALCAAERGLRIALANKEALVVGGSVLMPLTQKSGASLIPVDSEHSAVFQALHAGKDTEITRIILTASGGPFRTWTREQMAAATVQDALNHPKWSMGPKITIDSATMMNKALEIIEARWLFDVPPERIDVVVHPQAIVHSMVEFRDGSLVAQMGVPDMRTPIQYALTYPDRLSCPSPKLNLRRLQEMTFHEPDEQRFPALRLGREVASRGGTAGAVFNAANEMAVQLFRDGMIGFSEIAEQTERAVANHTWIAEPTREDLWNADQWAREEITRWVSC